MQFKNYMGSSLSGPPSKSPKPIAALLFLLACLAVAGADAHAQDAGAGIQEDAAPPPMRYVPEALRAQLSTARDIKARTRLSIELAEAQIARAGQHVEAERFDEATRELGVYEALVRDAINFLQNSGRVDNKRRDQYKRIEIALRMHVPIIENIRRNLPSQNAVYAKTTLDYIRNLRTEALNAFYDDTVLRDAAPPRSEPKPGTRADEASKQSPPQDEKKP